MIRQFCAVNLLQIFTYKSTNQGLGKTCRYPLHMTAYDQLFLAMSCIINLNCHECPNPPILRPPPTLPCSLAPFLHPSPCSSLHPFHRGLPSVLPPVRPWFLSVDSSVRQSFLSRPPFLALPSSLLCSVIAACRPVVHASAFRLQLPPPRQARQQT